MSDLIQMLLERYNLRADRAEFARDSGSTAYTLYCGERKLFLRKLKSAFLDTSLKALDIQIFLHKRGFPVPGIVFCADGAPYARCEDGLYVLYEYIEGEEPDPEENAEAIGDVTGRLHAIMKEYSGELTRRDKAFYILRYPDILRKRGYPKADAFLAYGEALWTRIENLPRGYCHGDLYRGNLIKSTDGKLFILDFDTSCEGFAMYDATLICDMTDYFRFDKRNYGRSDRVLSRFLPAYRKHCALSEEEEKAFHDLIAVEHFSTQATIMELFGSDCLDDAALDGQLDWLNRWRAQCEKGNLT